VGNEDLFGSLAHYVQKANPSIETCPNTYGEELIGALFVIESGKSLWLPKNPKTLQMYTFN